MWCHERVGRNHQRVVWLLVALAVDFTIGIGAVGSRLAYGDTQIIPSLTVSESYDSNVFFVPSSFVPGKKLWDYVTSASPQVTVEHRGQLIEGKLVGGAGANTYVNNPGLNYVSTNAALNLKMDGLVGQVIRGAKLQVSDTFLYTPQPPAFVTPEIRGTVSDAFIRGVQAFRANSYSNTVDATGSYAFTPTIGLQTGYMYSIFRFGSNRFITAIPGAFSSVFFSTTVHTIHGGPQVQLSPRDTATLDYQYMSASYGFFNFNSHGATAGYTRLLTPSIKATLNGGGTLIQPSNLLTYTGKATLDWTAGESSTISLSFSRAVAPSFFLAATALISQSVSIAFSHQLTQRLAVTATADYALNESAPTRSVFNATSYSGLVMLNYNLLRNVTASASYAYNNFDSNFGATSFQVDRHITMISIKAEWK